MCASEISPWRIEPLIASAAVVGQAEHTGALTLMENNNAAGVRMLKEGGLKKGLANTTLFGVFFFLLIAGLIVFFWYKGRLDQRDKGLGEQG